MARSILVCPSCKEPLKGSRCENPLCDVEDVSALFGSSDGTDPESVARGLAGTGRVFYNVSSEALVLRGDLSTPCISIPLGDPEGRGQSAITLFIQKTLGLSPKQYDDRKTREFVFRVHQVGPSPIPTVAGVNDYPMLMLHRDTDSLYFPDITTDLGRMMGDDLYTGPPLHPRDYGGLFEGWLETFRCASTEDRDVLRGWCLGALMQRLVPPGGFPGLLIAAHNNGAGKTASAEMLAAVLGRALNVYWPSIVDEEAFMRKVVSNQCRIVLVDNMTPEGDRRIIDASNLASIITRARFVVKRLYASTGSVSSENRNLYVLTANQPSLTPELMSRVVVLSLDKTTAFSSDWIKIWSARRVELLEDMMHLCITKWKEGPTDIVDRQYRFPEWSAAVSRVLRRAPTLRSPRPAVVSSYSWALEYMLGLQGLTEEPLEAMVRRLRDCRNGRVRALVQQQQVTPDLLRDELSMGGEWTVFEKEGRPWARLTYGASSRPKSASS